MQQIKTERQWGHEEGCALDASFIVCIPRSISSAHHARSRPRKCNTTGFSYFLSTLIMSRQTRPAGPKPRRNDPRRCPARLAPCSLVLRAQVHAGLHLPPASHHWLSTCNKHLIIPCLTDPVADGSHLRSNTAATYAALQEPRSVWG